MLLNAVYVYLSSNAEYGKRYTICDPRLLTKHRYHMGAILLIWPTPTSNVSSKPTAHFSMILLDVISLVGSLDVQNTH